MTIDGEIVTPDRRSSISSDLLVKKRKNRKVKRDLEQAKQNIAMERNKGIVDKIPIYQQNVVPDDSETEDLP